MQPCGRVVVGVRQVLKGDVDTPLVVVMMMEVVEVVVVVVVVGAVAAGAGHGLLGLVADVGAGLQPSYTCGRNGVETQERQRKGRHYLESEASNSRCLLFFLFLYLETF